MSHPSSSHEQTEAEALILKVVGRRLGAMIAPKRVDFPGGSYVHVDGVSQEPPVFGNEDTGAKVFEVVTEPILGELVDEACDEFGFTVWPATPLL